MYPNPQDALPLPPQPSLEHYRKLAKDLVKAGRSGDRGAIGDWARRWVDALVRLHQDTSTLRKDLDAESSAKDLAQYAVKKLLPADPGDARPTLADAQFIIARAHGFPSWPRFAKHLQSLALAASGVSVFEAAANAIVTGDFETLTRLVREHADVVGARSNREHRATLLHYVSANGIENYRQISPANAAQSAELLLEAGAEVDASARVYGSQCTTLGLVATSAPPAIVGVQLAIIDVLLEHGARMDLPGNAGRNHSLIHSCLANGQPEAAEYLATRGAPLDLVGAAGLGRLDAVEAFFDAPGRVGASPTDVSMLDAFYFACAYGRVHVVDFLLHQGIGVDVELRGHGDGHAGLHVAAFHGHTEVVDLLLHHGASVDVVDKTWGTSPLLWALTGWIQGQSRDDTSSYAVVAALVAAGSEVRRDIFEWEKIRADPAMRAALSRNSM
jgi:ankyrin repeat protein